MKKTNKLIAFIFCVFLLSGIKVHARELNNWDNFPQGDNYLDPANHSLIVCDEQAGIYSFSTSNPFRIKANQTYSLFVTAVEFDQIIDYKFFIYDQVLHSICEPELNEIRDGNGRITALSFLAPPEAIWISLEIEFKNSNQDGTNYEGQLDLNFVFCEGEEYPVEHGRPLAYINPFHNLEIVEKGEYGIYLTDVEKPIDVEEIKKSLRAFDESEGDVTKTIKIALDNYTENKKTLGSYEVKFRANDQNNNQTFFTVYIHVLDNDAPQIEGILRIEATSSILIDIENIISGLELTDNYDHSSDLELELLSDDYTENYNKVGTYNIKFKLTDKSGNSSLNSVVVNVSDTIEPLIYGPWTHGKTNKIDVSLAEFLEQYRAEDETDGDITDKIEVIEDNYTRNQNNPGNWTFVLSVRDAAGNTTTRTAYVEVIDVIYPIFFVDKTKIVIDLSSEPLTTNSIIDYLKKARVIEEGAIVELLEDTYSMNRDQPGNYKLVFANEGEELIIEIEVVEELTEIVIPEKVGFFKKIANFFLRIWQAIIYFLKKIFYKL